ncbi:sulfotransferase family 2 domain-containing protein [uncultured Roseobacter sp.]|uniref:sulfotransferase family 2 domain-containing protein n=1 Tax=uncultured Roseobacter sp. TaxID=114847 RepID=UPI00262AF270|nr:sulfotransferase family 2 domain-containing protein [uncultured Roseobacter sp.]
MTNFILRDPKVVFVHLPKTGGKTVRSALGGCVENRFFGHIPDEYAQLLRFAIIRDPKTRFLSTFRMFKYGNALDGDGYAEPRWPDLTISTALDVLDDPWIGFDRSHRTLTWNLKHHILPQTHPFNCLAEAQRILRFENLQADFDQLCAQLDVPSKVIELPEPINQQQNEDVWGREDEARFLKIFYQDYKALDYSPNGQSSRASATSATVIKPARALPTVYKLWSAYFSDRSILMDAATEALPKADCPLEPFVDEIIPGQPERTWARRADDLMVHFHKLQPEFAGASRLAHLLACTIVVLRRDPKCKTAATLFWRILDEQFDVIRSELSLRWLVSIADTLADFGRDTEERAIGLSASVFANTSKLYESERMVFLPKRPWPPKKRMARGGALFDGLITYWTEKGDLINNMIKRSAKIAELSPTAGKVLMEVVERLQKGPTVYRRFALIRGQPPVPLLRKEDREEMRRMMMSKL